MKKTATEIIKRDKESLKAYLTSEYGKDFSLDYEEKPAKDTNLPYRQEGTSIDKAQLGSIKPEINDEPSPDSDR